MQSLEKFAATQRPHDAPGRIYLSQLLGDPANVDGYWSDARILAQYECAPGYLVLYDNQAPYENGPELLLLDRELALLDEQHIGPSYPVVGASSETDQIRAHAEAITFEAFAKAWRVEVLPRPRWGIRSLLNVALFLPTMRKRWLRVQTEKQA